jgi:acyl-CoA synthetase (NDP forming)
MAFISQSGAMIAARLSSLPELNPKYLVSVGNQSDLTVSDYLEFLGASEEIEFFAVYLEGFRPEDGSRFFRTASKLFKAGKRVILYRAGRTRAGEAAAKSHTASIGGDYRATIALAEQSGIAVAKSLDEFQDLIRLFAALRSKSIAGLELALVSNAGFECVAFADHIQEANVAQFSAHTVKTLRSILERSNAAELIDIHNPLDITAMGDDQTFIDVLNTLLEDQQIDAVVLGCVPMSPSLETVPGPEGVETGFGPDSIVGRLVDVHRKSPKPFVVVVDGGDLYQPFINELRRKGVPVLLRMDYAVSIFEKYLMKRLGN